MEEVQENIFGHLLLRDETRSTPIVCPCTKTDTTYTGAVPPFVGEDYFCDTGSEYAAQFQFYYQDPLWDG